MPRLLLLIGALVLLGACGGDNTPAPVPTPGPDRVVGVEVRCDRWTDDGQHREYWGDGCLFGTQVTDSVADGSIVVIPGGDTGFNVRKLVTVRTFAGAAYTVSVSQNRTVSVGDTWP